MATDVQLLDVFGHFQATSSVGPSETAPGTWVRSLPNYGSPGISHIVRLPEKWTDGYANGLMISVAGLDPSRISYGLLSYRSKEYITSSWIHGDVGTDYASFASGWSRLRFLSRAGWTSGLFAQRTGKYVYHLYYSSRYSGGYDKTYMHIAKISDPEDINFLANGTYFGWDGGQFTDIPFGPIGGGGYVTDHEYPWIWIMENGGIWHFRDDGRSLGSYTRSGIPRVQVNYGRWPLSAHRYTAASTDLAYGPIFAHPWNCSNFGPPELWFFMRRKSGGIFTGHIDIYRARWLPYQAALSTRISSALHIPTPAYTIPDIYAANAPDFYEEGALLENPQGYAFDRNWYSEQNIVGTINSTTYWAPEGVPYADGLTRANPSSVALFRSRQKTGRLFLVFGFGSWTLVFVSDDNGATWERPERDLTSGNVGAFLLDDDTRVGTSSGPGLTVLGDTWTGTGSAQGDAISWRRDSPTGSWI